MTGVSSAIMRDVDDTKLAGVVDELRELLLATGHADKAHWLVLREQALRSGIAEEAAKDRADLRGIIDGMGGLLDLYLPTADERERLQALTESVWQATKV